MSDGYNTRTLKLKIYPFGEEQKKTKDRFYQIANDTWKAANWISSGQYLNDQLIRRVYARRKIDVKDKAQVEGIEREFFDKDGYFGSKRQASTERDIKEAFPNIPPCVSNALNQVVVSSYNKEKSNMLMGKRSLRSYKQGMAFTTSKVSVTFFDNEDGKHGIVWKLGREEHLSFYIYYGKDKGNYRETIQSILNDSLDYSAPQLQVKEGAFYLLLPVKDLKKEIELDSNLSVGVDLGVSTPAYVALSKGPAKEALGSIKDFLRIRMQIQRRTRETQRSLKLISGGNGRTKKLRALNRFRDNERNFAKSYNHKVSRNVIDFAVKHKAGVIKMEMLEGFGDERSNGTDFILRNWSYFELQNMIEYKAKRFGINVVKVDPYHTSQTCSACGNYEFGQRKDREFICAKCGNKTNADHNAAVNIARSTLIVSRKEDCQYFKLHQKKAA